MMTTDALQIYSRLQPLTRIEKIPSLGNYQDTLMPPIYGIKKDDPYYAGPRVDAVWAIQRYWRRYRAKKIAARLRFEVWARAADSQRSLVSILANNNVITHQANTLASVFGLKPAKEIHYDEIRHNIVSLRLKTSRKVVISQKASILREAELSMKDRIKFMQAMTRKWAAALCLLQLLLLHPRPAVLPC